MARVVLVSSIPRGQATRAVAEDDRFFPTLPFDIVTDSSFLTMRPLFVILRFSIH